MYKGDVLPKDAHERLQANDKAVLIDVRTDAEWAFVGIPAVEGLVRVPWQFFPTMERNADFVDQVAADDRMGHRQCNGAVRAWKRHEKLIGIAGSVRHADIKCH